MVKLIIFPAGSSLRVGPRLSYSSGGLAIRCFNANGIKLNNWRTIITALFLCLSAWSGDPAAWASPLDIYGFGPRAIALGGAFTGLADDYSALYYNPAGLSYIPENNLNLGIVFARPFLNLNLEPAPDITRREADNLEGLEREKTNLEDVNAYFLGTTTRVNKYLALGAYLYMPQGMVIRLKPIDSHSPSFIWYANRAKRAVAGVGGSLMPLSGISLGGGVSIFADCKGTMVIPVKATNDNFSLDPDKPTNEPMDIDATLNLDFPLTYTPFAGVMVRPTEWLRVGASYTASFRWDVRVAVDADLILENYKVNLADLPKIAPGLLPLKGTVEIRAPALGDKPLRVPIELSKLEGLVALSLRLPVNVLAAMVDHWSPQHAAFGASVDLGNNFLLTSDVTWYDWSSYPTPDLKISIDDMKINLSSLPASIRARLQTVTVPILGTLGPLPPVSLSIPGVSTTVNLKFQTKQTIKPDTHDIFVPRVGLEYRLMPIDPLPLVGEIAPALRVGYSYQPSPFEPDGGYINLVDPDKHLFSAGFGLTFNHRFLFDVYGQYQYLEPLHFEKSLIDPEMAFDAVSAQGYVLSAGASVGFKW